MARSPSSTMGNHTVVTMRVHSTTVLTPLLGGGLSARVVALEGARRGHAVAAPRPMCTTRSGSTPRRARFPPRRQRLCRRRARRRRRLERSSAASSGHRRRRPASARLRPAPPPRTIVGQGDPVSLSQIAMAVGEQGADKGDPMVTIRMPDGDEAKMRLSELIMVDSPAVTWTLPKRPTKKQLAQVNASSALRRRINDFFDKNHRRHHVHARARRRAARRGVQDGALARQGARLRRGAAAPAVL